MQVQIYKTALLIFSYKTYTLGGFEPTPFCECYANVPRRHRVNRTKKFDRWSHTYIYTYVQCLKWSERKLYIYLKL
jgi:hypothetical protein